MLHDARMTGSTGRTAALGRHGECRQRAETVDAGAVCVFGGAVIFSPSKEVAAQDHFLMALFSDHLRMLVNAWSTRECYTRFTRVRVKTTKSGEKRRISFCFQRLVG
jgi:hypothetical protein